MERVYQSDPIPEIQPFPPNQLAPLGRYIVEVYGPDGKIKHRHIGSNVVCTNGKEFMASFLNSAALAASTFTAKYLAVGTDATTPSAANTALGTEIARQTGTVSYVSNQIFQVTATLATGSGTGAIVEYGLFTSSSGGTLISRDTDSVVNKNAADTMKIIYQMTIS